MNTIPDTILADASFKIAEKWLYNFTKWTAEIIVLRANLEDPAPKITTGYSSAGGSSGGDPGDKTYSRAKSLLQAEANLPQLLRKTKVISAAINSLGYQHKQLVTLKFIKRRNNQFIWEHLQFTGESEFYRKRREAIDQVREILLKDHGFQIEVEEKAAKLSKQGGETA